jgi:hypothetical protein
MLRIRAMTANLWLDRTSTAWLRYARQFIIAALGYPVVASTLER